MTSRLKHNRSAAEVLADLAETLIGNWTSAGDHLKLPTIIVAVERCAPLILPDNILLDRSDARALCYRATALLISRLCESGEMHPADITSS